MQPLRFARVLASIALLSLLLCSYASAASYAGRAALRICTNCASTGGDLSRYDYVILHSWEYARIPGIKAANPNVKVLMYKNAVATYDYLISNGTDWDRLSSGVGYVDADVNHP